MTLGSICLVAYFHIAIATARIPNWQVGANISTIASIIVTAALVTTVVRFQPDNRARYALASLYANGSMALCLIGHLVFSFQLSAVHIMGILLAAWHSFMTRNRYQQLKESTYLLRFEPKPKLPSPWDVLKQARASRRA